MNEQSAAATEVALDVEHIAPMAERNDASASEAADGAARLQALAMELKAQVERFSTDPDLRGSLGGWKQAVALP